MGAGKKVPVNVILGLGPPAQTHRKETGPSLEAYLRADWQMKRMEGGRGAEVWDRVGQWLGMV